MSGVEQAIRALAEAGGGGALAALEAHVDPRIRAALPDGVAAEVERAGLAGAAPGAVAETLAALAAGREIAWTTRTVTQGEVLAAFARHCADDLDDVAVVEASPSLLVARWRRETATIEARHGVVGCERLVTDQPRMLLVDLEGDMADVIEAFANEEALRGGLALLDLARLEKINTVRSSILVYLEWFLREAYGVKLLTSGTFTQGLIARGIISLGFG